ncbi:MAG TPA: IS91 family transposase, partial [Kiloniellaceae bacterium]|nr:IS91 family transposase [Kiloniellaceae bacterium]
PRLRVAEVFRAHGEAYQQTHGVTAAERAVIRAIVACRTSVLGGHLEVCPHCGLERPVYNSCRNRHCPSCQALKQAQWIAARQERVLPTQYFHLVFTLPARLRPLVWRNRERLFDLLFAAASQTLLTLGRDPARLGGTLAVTCVLHTWTRELQFHPHVHCIVAGGGLSADSTRWVAARRRYLFPAKVLSRLFRGKFLAALTAAYDRGHLDLAGACAPLADRATFAGLTDALYAQEWVVYAKPTLAGPQQVFAYLGRYTHRVGISDQRLRALDERGVTFATKDGRVVTLAPAEFIRRFLLHVLPPRFVKIRHYGLCSPAHARTTLEHARALLAPDDGVAASAPLPRTAHDWMLRLTGRDLTRCPGCGYAPLARRPLAAARAASFTPPQRNWDTS